MNIKNIKGIFCPFYPGRVVNDDCHKKCYWFNKETEDCGLCER